MGDGEQIRPREARRARFYRPAKLPRVSRRGFVAAGVALGAVWIAGNFVFSEYGLRNLLIQERIERRLTGEIAALESRHAGLTIERQALERDSKAIERIAREKYLLGKSDEVTYVFVPVDSAGIPLPTPPRSLSTRPDASANAAGDRRAPR